MNRTEIKLETAAGWHAFPSVFAAEGDGKTLTEFGSSSGEQTLPGIDRSILPCRVFRLTIVEENQMQIRELARTLLCLALVSGVSLGASARSVGGGVGVGVGASVGGAGVGLRGDMGGSVSTGNGPAVNSQATANSNGRLTLDRDQGLDRAAERMNAAGLSHTQAAEARATSDERKAATPAKRERRRIQAATQADANAN